MSVHIIAVISWMAGLLYIFRLFVYHAMETEAVVKERFKVMERKLYKVICAPAMVVAFVMGLGMLSMNPSLFEQNWMQAKLILVTLLIAITHYSGRLVKHFAADKVRRSHKFFRVWNEVPTLLMIFIVFLVIMKPF